MKWRPFSIKDLNSPDLYTLSGLKVDHAVITNHPAWSYPRVMAQLEDGGTVVADFSGTHRCGDPDCRSRIVVMIPYPERRIKC